MFLRNPYQILDINDTGNKIWLQKYRHTEKIC